MAGRGRGKSSRPCRNILIHGFCKFEGKGCEFNHESTPSSSSNSNNLQSDLRIIKPFNVPSNPPLPYELSADYETALDSSPFGFPTGGFNQNSLGTEFLGSSTQAHNQFYMAQNQNPSAFMNYDVLQYHLATNPLPHVSNLTHNQKSIHAFFMSDKLKEDLLRRNEVTLRVINDNPDIPSEVHGYHSLFPLDELRDSSMGEFNVESVVYKGISSNDGKPYSLLRLIGYRLSNDQSIGAIESWRRIRHSNIISVREAFTTKQFGDNSLVFVYDYHPMSVTMKKRYFQRPHPDIAEKNLWSFAIQMVSALKTIHSAGLACRVLCDPSKIYITGKNRFRINCAGIMDMLSADAKNFESVSVNQDADVKSLGLLLAQLAANNLAINDCETSIESLPKTYSKEFKDFILFLANFKGSTSSFDNILSKIGSRILHDINNVHHYNDFLESELSKELENGRISRLLCKMGMINERPEYDLDPEWSESGDRYFVKLFRDYVFHQEDEHGRPCIDFAHIIQCLNKLDAGSHEKIMLMTRDESSCIIVSYKDLKKCIETSFQELVARSNKRGKE